MMPFDSGGLPPPPYVWVVEMRVVDRWEPTVSAALTKAGCKNDLEAWRKQNPNDKFRVEKYIRAQL